MSERDPYHEGYGYGSSGRDWLATVAGRFLRAHERRALYDGWRAGQRDVTAWRADMATGADVACDSLELIPL